MNFQRIDLEHWHRKPYFEHYMNAGKCSFSITANIRITELLDRLRDKNMKLYPAFIYMVSKVVNAYPEFRTAFNDKGELGYWERLNPCYTIFHQEDKTFSAVWSEYSEDFPRFYQTYLGDTRAVWRQKWLWAKKDVPANSFSVSSIPWTSFTSFDLHLANTEHLLPIITNGKYFSQGNDTYLPVSLQVHHAVCDGYHAGVFMNDVERLADCCGEWLL
ncbi:type A chloramphenicol O-acetyltransferase [Bacillus glycinifermentans]|uniref:type A chloramphenicol O-acetyltransferase n=1 Tax=Bacillus glycinifermentans TaxID=1664069 RepID=UPI001FF66BEE|nr:type A chloramphenicol O-acetyltransferase [Bacillus glycinifermentans]MEC3605819.1 type A chloramphenicol O-acetyltransferase [Bacillus glycinifermentans]UOY90084.1 type A chloramphenicol O-acetyltransferase [Bacillus glycinifermentans]